MNIIDILRPTIGLLVGVMAGWMFGLIQQSALRRNEQRQGGGKSIGALGVMPGSMRRVAFFLVLLVAIQLLFPMLFVRGSQWWISGGVAIGYGTLLFRQLLRTRSALNSTHNT